MNPRDECPSGGNHNWTTMLVRDIFITVCTKCGAQA